MLPGTGCSSVCWHPLTRAASTAIVIHGFIPDLLFEQTTFLKALYHWYNLVDQEIRADRCFVPMSSSFNPASGMRHAAIHRQISALCETRSIRGKKEDRLRGFLGS